MATSTTRYQEKNREFIQKYLNMKTTFLICFFCITNVTVYAETTINQAEKVEMINAHNKWRSKVSVPMLKWSAILANTAQDYADSLKVNYACEMIHSNVLNLGENLYWASPTRYSDGTSKIQVITPNEVTDAWGNEINDYTYSTNSCASGKMCGHYTQVVWHSTTEVGCGKAICQDNSQVWVCNYSPAGNYVGKKPY